MRQYFLSVCLALVCTAGHAQLKVQNDGKVCIGTPNLTAKSWLSVGSDGNQNYTVSFYPMAQNGVMIDNRKGTTGLYILNGCVEQGEPTGIAIIPMGQIGEGKHSGIKALGGPTSGYSYGVCGQFFNLTRVQPEAAAGIYGSCNLYDKFAYPGIYAGYFNGDVRVTGTLYANVLTPSSTSSSAASSVSALAASSDEERVSDKLLHVSLLRFENKASKSVKYSAKDTSVMLNWSDSMTEEQVRAAIEKANKEADLNAAIAPVYYGLAADELREVYPEFVHEDDNGNVSINYVEMIPLLVQSINELKSEIRQLRNASSSLVKGRETATGMGDEGVGIEGLSVEQNIPNPFNDKTVISLEIPEKVGSASLLFYDVNGKQIKSVKILERGKVSVPVTSAEFDAGIYLYSLIADGKVVATKRMVLTK